MVDVLYEWIPLFFFIFGGWKARCAGIQGIDCVETTCVLVVLVRPRDGADMAGLRRLVRDARSFRGLCVFT